MLRQAGHEFVQQLPTGTVLWDGDRQSEGTRVVLVRIVHFSYGLVTVCKSVSLIVTVLVSELNHFSAY